MFGSSKYTATAQCQESGCAERGHFGYDTKRAVRDGAAYRNRWRCVRHTSPNEVLSLANRERSAVLVATRVEHLPNDLFWGGSNGFAHGPGFKAWAKDFPEGARLEITARIVLPSEREEVERV
jgi:hypothetical protein